MVIALSSALSRYDSLLVLHLCSLSDAKPIQAAVQAAAKSTQQRLLVYFSSTAYWKQLVATSQSRQRHFGLVQSFISQVYVLASAELREDAGVDIVIEALRGGQRLVEEYQSVKQRFAFAREVSLEQPDGLDQQAGEEESEKDCSELGTVALGGTFDHLHPGHQILLTMACWLAGRRVIVGVTGALALLSFRTQQIPSDSELPDDLLLRGKSDRDLLESLTERTAAVRSFLSLVGPHLQHDTPALQNVYGPTATDPDVQGILVSEETRLGASSIAAKRAENSLSTLRMFVIKVISPRSVLDDKTSAQDLVKIKIGSTAIRRRMKERMIKQGEQ
ncbi:MAG: hypothetical protein CYPHOPRED_005827 [Cyphobasidiales sp. Tagirdzhanova-0007]|nr:MAG: hypothetical protein CYPHOPRED_005827 [Cyphobasidiales sp. Tagirdzhanova-0007]